MCAEACLKRILGGLLVAVMAAGLAVTITAQAPAGDTIYACVNPAGLVRIIPPRAACLGSEQPIHWNVTGPAGPQGLPGPAAASMYFLVECAAADKVNDALEAGTDQSGRLFIEVRGTCQESVYISRDDVILYGHPDGGSLAAPSPDRNVLTIAGGQRISVNNLTLQDGSYGFLVHDGGGVQGRNLRITGNRTGLEIWDGTVRLSRTTIEANTGNVTVGAGGRLYLSEQSAIRDADFQGAHTWGGVIDLNDVTVSGNAGFGIGVMQARVRIENSTITGNGRLGVWLHGGGVSIGHSRIADHTGHGVEVSAGTVDVSDTTIESSGWSGIQAMMGSRIIVGGGNAFRANSQHGIWLKDTSVVSGFNPVGTQITGNRRWGILCDPAPAVAQIGPHFSGTGFILNATHVFGNTEGQISCPGILVP